MIITKTVEQIMTGKNIKHYRNLGYHIKPFEKILIPVEHLPINSRCEIEVSCEKCETNKKMRYEHYNKCCLNQGYYVCIKCCFIKKTKTTKQKYGVEHNSQTKKAKAKMKKTNLKKYGVESVLQHPVFLIKMKKTNLKKYGVEFVSQNEDIKKKVKETTIKNGFQTPDELKSKWELYNILVDKITRKYKKQLFEEWDGNDFYDKEYIKNNLKLHHTNKNYPSIDHKISVFYGFKNNISAEQIGSIKNLCITKRTLNSKKHTKCEF
jgi:hypothetical protein